jgi:hypothetical protein
MLRRVYKSHAYMASISTQVPSRHQSPETSWLAGEAKILFRAPRDFFPPRESCSRLPPSTKQQPSLDLNRHHINHQPSTTKSAHDCMNLRSSNSTF